MNVSSAKAIRVRGVVGLLLLVEEDADAVDSVTGSTTVGEAVLSIVVVLLPFFFEASDCGGRDDRFFVLRGVSCRDGVSRFFVFRLLPLPGGGGGCSSILK
jgi:hypothetical protein